MPREDVNNRPQHGKLRAGVRHECGGQEETAVAGEP